MTAMDRRQALTLLASLAFVPRGIAAQARATAAHRVVLGPSHGFLLEPGGTLQAWQLRPGDKDTAIDALGLGDNRPLAPYTIAPVPGLTNVVKAAAGSACSFAVLGDGRLLSWGLNAGDGLLGTTPLSVVETLASWGPNSNRPVPLVTRFDAVDVSAGGSHVLALSRDGAVYAWGRGDKGQLGIGALPVIRFKTRTPSAMPYVPFPVRLPGLADVAGISAGSTHSLAVLKDGTVRAWGENRWGQLGDGTTTNRDAPVTVPGVANAVAVAAGGNGFSAALLADGSVMTWGNRSNGALGRTPAPDARPDPTPARVPGVQGVRAIAAGHAHVLALTEAGTVLSWGDESFGQLGRGPRAQYAPAVITSQKGVRSIAAFGSTSVAVLDTGRIMTWGVVRPWTRPPEDGSMNNLSRSPILLWLDGLEQP
ncbi:MAG: RCC1 domain-containing protein [Vicinamibacterales bacterium]